MIIKYHKKAILVTVGEPYFIRKEATVKHKEVTVAVVNYALPINSIASPIIFCPAVVKAAKKAALGFQDIKLEFNGNPQALAFTFQITAKTERRGNDVHNQELADKIVIAKANSKACNTAGRVLSEVRATFAEELKRTEPIEAVFESYAIREMNYAKGK